MKIRNLSHYARRAVAVTIGRVDCDDLHAPTYDGRTLHIARIKKESHVLHEVAHWICASTDDRARPNYGLGRDPDHGPYTLPKWLEPTELAGLVSDAGLDPTGIEEAAPKCASLLVALSKAKGDREESLAAVVSIILERLAGLTWVGEMGRVFGNIPKQPDGYGMDIFWCYVDTLLRRGVDLVDPLAPFARVQRTT